MIRIEKVEIAQVDIPPKVVRTDAFQSFVTQETVFVARPRHDFVHRRQELIAPRRFAKSLKARAFIGRRRKGLLFHQSITHHVNSRGPFSVNP